MPERIEINNPEEELLLSLKQIAEVQKDFIGVNAYILTFPNKESRVTIRVLLESDGELLITNMTTLPENTRGSGLGSDSLNTLLQWADQKGIINIRATQVSKESASFWVSNGFIKDLSNTQTNDYLLKPNHGQ